MFICRSQSAPPRQRILEKATKQPKRSRAQALVSADVDDDDNDDEDSPAECAADEHDELVQELMVLLDKGDSEARASAAVCEAEAEDASEHLRVDEEYRPEADVDDVAQGAGSEVHALRENVDDGGDAALPPELVFERPEPWESFTLNLKKPESAPPYGG